MTFTALFVLNYWLREFSLSMIANCFELRCQSKATNAIVLQNVSMSERSMTFSFLKLL